MRRSAWMKDRTNRRRSGDVVREDKEGVGTWDDSQAVSLAEAGWGRNASADVRRIPDERAYLSKIWFCASAAWRRAHCRSGQSSVGPVQNRHTTDASRS